MNMQVKSWFWFMLCKKWTRNISRISLKTAGTTANHWHWLLVSIPQSFCFEMFDSIQCSEIYSNVYVFDPWEIAMEFSMLLSNWAKNPVRVSFLGWMTPHRGQLVVAMLLGFRASLCLHLICHSLINYDLLSNYFKSFFTKTNLM